jgi:hypothetical protein
VSDFCPDGYVPSQDAVFRAAVVWFPDKIAALESAPEPQSQTKPKNTFDAAVRAFSQPLYLEQWRRTFEEIASQTVPRLRNFLHQGTLTAYYFADDGSHSVSREFWATSNADGVIETGLYWPFGRPSSWRDTRLSHSIFLAQSELDALLSEQPSKKRPLPKSKIPELVAALRKLDNLPNREKQREALRKLPEFEQYHLTDHVLREAERRAPRDPGRKRHPPEE